MRKFFFLTVIISLLVFVGACSRKGADSSPEQKSVHGAADSGGKERVGYIPVIRDHKLAQYQSATIGDAFDSYRYFEKKEWKERTAADGNTYIDFIGWFDAKTLNENASKDGVTARGIDVMFVIEPNGSYYVFMVSKIERRSDGKEYSDQIQDSAGILASIYANKKISL